MKKIGNRIIITIMLVMSIMIGAYNTTFAAENMIPNYEVKLLLDSDEVLNSDNLFKKDYRNIFETGKSYKTIGVLFIDTEDLMFNQQGWINRIRIKENSDTFDLTYKKRYSVLNGDVTGALNIANSEGFDITDTNYEAQVDWGYNNMTLSLSCEKEESNNGYAELELPSKSEAISILKDHMPGKLEDWMSDNWGKDTIENGKKFGPIYYMKYSGTFDGRAVDIEIWPIENQSMNAITYITEISFKSDSFEDASMGRAALITYLDSLGILEHCDSLKTQLILNNY